MEHVLIFLLLNFLLFLPRFFLNKKTSTFIPYKEIFTNEGIRLQPLISRFNDDIFRVNFELALAVLLIVFFKATIAIQVAQQLFFIFYLSTLLIFYYHYSVYSIYKTYPAITVDFPLLKEGLNIAKSGYKKSLLLGIIAFFTYGIGLYFLSTYFVAQIYFKDSISLLLLCFLILLLALLFKIDKKVNFFKYATDGDFHYLTFAVVQSTIYLVNSNLYYSSKSKKDILKIPGYIERAYLEIPIKTAVIQKPNVFFIAIESYGAVLYENAYFKQEFEKTCSSLSLKFQEKGLFTASNLSKSPVTGGASWVSYSSLLTGVNIENNFIYNYLFNNQSKYKTQSILDIFENLDYKSFLISGLGGYENYPIEWNKILNFLGAKNVIKFKDLDYQGPLFNFGPSAPDQYLLHKSMEIMKQKSGNKPLVSFVETINSHYPFESPTLLLDDWNDCTTASEKDFKTLSKSVSIN